MARRDKTNATDDPATLPADLPQEATAAPDTGARALRPGSKLAQVIALLEAREGATIPDTSPSRLSRTKSRR